MRLGRQLGLASLASDRTFAATRTDAAQRIFGKAGDLDVLEALEVIIPTSTPMSLVMARRA